MTSPTVALPRQHLARLDLVSSRPSVRDVAVPRTRAVATKAALVAADGIAVAAAMILATLLRSLAGRVSLPADDLRLDGLAVLSLPVWLALFAHYRLYAARCVASRLEEFKRVVHAVMASVAVIVAVSYLTEVFVPRGWLLATFLLSIALVTLEREVARRWFIRARRTGRLIRRVIIVGANAEARAMASMLTDHPSLGYAVLGFVDDDAPIGRDVGGIRVRGRIDDVLDVTRAVGATGVIVATTAVGAEDSNRLARRLTDQGIHVELSSSLRDIASERLTVQPLGRCAVVYVEPVRRAGWRAVAKRSFDVFVSGSALVACSPLLLAVAVAVKLDSRGTALFRQERVGQGGRRFPVLKFRTMFAESDAQVVHLADRNEADGPLFKMRNDPRVTRVGRVLRKLSIDELPQLWNVVRGDMSLVGPRPALAREMRHWSAELHNRLTVKPGITGMWQVSGRSDSSFDEYVRWDLYYVDNWSLLTDIAIVAKTVPTVLFGRGAY
jgi:exopolysaccharide biosynthesis polyprenyl glycosylphosphotransferase